MLVSRSTVNKVLEKVTYLVASLLMLFSDLLLAKHDPDTGRIDLGPLADALPSTPHEVLSQVFSDHGRNCSFQDAYGHVAISELQWELRTVVAQDLGAVQVHPEFARWYENVQHRARLFEDQGFKCIDVRAAVRSQWERHGTWLVPPVLIEGELVGAAGVLRLVEGHTRLGVLNGLVAHGVLAPTSSHQIWLGSLRVGADTGR